MIPAPPRISAPPRVPPHESPPRRESCPRPRPSPPRVLLPTALAPPRGLPRAHRPQLPPRLTTQTSPPFRHATRDSQRPTLVPARPHPTRRRFPPAPAPLGGAPFRPRLSARACWRLFARIMPVGCRVPSTTPVRHAWHHAYLGPSRHNPMGTCLSNN